MKLENILDELIGLNISIKLKGNDLQIEGPKENIHTGIIDKIRGHKEEILCFLRSAQEGNDTLSNINAVEAHSSGYPLSSSQRSLYFLCQIAKGNVAYNICGVYWLEGHLDIEALKCAFFALVERHEVLRTVFRENEYNEIRQYILPANSEKFMISYQDLIEMKDKEREVRTILQSEIDSPFDLEFGPLLRLKLLHVTGEKYILMYSIHHIISDGWSMGIIMKELITFYNSFTNGLQNNLKPLRIHYKDYSVWQQTQLENGKLEKHQEYWLKQLGGELPIANLPIDKRRPRIKTFEGGAVTLHIDYELLQEIGTLGAKSGSTLFMCVLAAVNVLLYKYTGQEEFIIGSPVAGRDHNDLEPQIGFYVNILPLRVKFDANFSYKDLLAKVKKICLEAYKFQAFPIDEVIDKLQLKRSLAKHPLFDVMVVLQSKDLKKAPETGFANVAINNYDGGEYGVSKFDMTFTFSELPAGLQVALEYNSDIFAHESIERMLNHLKEILVACIKYPDTPLAFLEYLSLTEKHQLLVEFNNKQSYGSNHLSLAELFRNRVAATPDRIAVVYEDQELTFKEVDQRATQLARKLIAAGMEKGTIVGLLVDRSPELVIGILGILKGGGAFLPLDVNYPQDRLNYMLKDSNCSFLITQRDQSTRLYTYKGRVLYVSDTEHWGEAGIKQYRMSSGKDLAYVIYTSGSTGYPKGVAITNAGIVNTILYQCKYFEMKEGENSLQFASPGFDASVAEIFTTLVSGGTLYIISESMKKDVALFAKYIVNNCIDVATIPPAYLQLIELDRIRSIKKLISAGESARRDILIDFSSSGSIYYNAYGPTEISISASTHRGNPENDSKNEIIPIGKPNANTYIYVLDTYDQLVPIGVIGEICIGGVGVGLGYLNNVELTSDRFITNPFRKGELMYRSGDLGKWLLDGSVVFMGRSDNQVKIRGYRVELAEIEQVLLRHEGIKECVVLARQQGFEIYLCAYVVGGEKDTGALRHYLSAKVPGYMVPRDIVIMNQLPLNANGKIDFNALPLVQATKQQNHQAARNQTEEKLVNIWSEVLSLPPENISVTDNFFELGGHSLSILKVVSHIKKEFNFSFPVTNMYNEPVIENIAKVIEIKSELNSEITYFNPGKEENFFCFPPIVGHGYCYKRLADILSGYRFCSFNYIKSENEVDYYVNEILRIQPEPPYILIGYSAGSIMMYPIAKELERRGKQLSKLIILDGQWIEFKKQTSMDWAHELFDHKIEALNLDFLKRDLYKKISDYDSFLRSIQFGEKLNSDLHIIISEGFGSKDNDEAIRSKVNKIQSVMGEYTKKSIVIHKGFGLHENFLDEEYSQKNAKIINEILTEKMPH